MVRNLAIAVLLMISLGCTKKAVEPVSKVPEYFSGMRGCFLLYNMKSNAFEKVIGEERCKERFPACSTFKVPLAVMAFDSGVLKDENVMLKWDGVTRTIPEHNHDHNAKTWMRDSVVWFSQMLTPRIREKRVKKYLHDFQYGNEDLSGGLTQAWLTSPSSRMGALSISAYEQVDFLKKLWTDKLPASKRSQRITREITFLETSPKGFKLSGKTGSNFYDKAETIRLGWFISHLDGNGQEYIAITNFSDETPTTDKVYGGQKAKQIMKTILTDQGLW